MSRLDDYSESFPRSLRLTEASQYQIVFRASRRCSNRALVLLYRPNKLGHSRLGMAVSRKHIRKAVDRHRIKRLIRESFRTSRHRLPTNDMVILSRPAAANLSNHELRQKLSSLWQQVTDK